MGTGRRNFLSIMRTFILLLFCLFSMKPLAFCKNHGVPRFPTPKDPFADWLPIEERNKINANKIVCKNYEAGVNLSYTNTTFYNYSEDGLTVFSHNGNNKPIMTYTFYPNGKLKNYIVPSSNTNDTYTYTDDGKLLSMESSFHKIQCYYTNTGVDSLASWFYSDRYEKFIKNEKYIISYNSKGYKKEIFRYNIEKGSYIKDLEDLYEFDKIRIYFKSTFFSIVCFFSSILSSLSDNFFVSSSNSFCLS